MRPKLLIFALFLSAWTIYAQEESDETPRDEVTPPFEHSADAPPDEEVMPPSEYSSSFDYPVYNHNNGLSADIFIRLMSWPLQRTDVETFEYFIWPLLTLRVGFGIGYNYEIKKGLFSPGAYFDFGISPLLLLSDSEEDEDEKEKEEDDMKPFLLDMGLRINNQFRWNNFDIKPFYGISFNFGDSLLHQVGLFLGIKNIGFEYTYLFNMFREKVAFHRISFMLHSAY